MSDNKNLVVGVQQHLTTQVKTANIQLLISSQLTQDIERRRFVEILKSIDRDYAVSFISRYLYLNEALIEQYQDKWAWGGLSGNKVLPWSLALIEQYKNQWDWKWLSTNEALPWSLALIEQYKDQWKWGWLCNSAVACLPKLSPQDIDEVMSHHFPFESRDEEYCDDEEEHYYNDDQGAYYGDDGYLGDGMWSDSSKNDWNR